MIHSECPEPLRNLLRRVSYRPNWTFEVEKVQEKFLTLLIKGRVINTDNFGETIPLSFGIGIPEYVRDSFDWSRWLFDQIMIVENHEAREFFKIDGVKVFDPHA